MQDELLRKNDNEFIKDFFGARKETIVRLNNLYKKAYFSNSRLERQRKEMYLQEYKRLNNYFDLSKRGKVLDIGCGKGDFLFLFGKQWKKFGIEISEYARNIAHDKGIIVDFGLEDDYFDLIIFRGTIQHIPDPISRIEKCYYWLKEGGVLVFLATPNTNSIYYKLFGSLPMLKKEYNFLFPSDKMLIQILTNFGFKIKGIEYPYRDTPYAFPLRDYFNFLMKLFRIRKNVTFPFHRNMMECYAVKNNIKGDSKNV